MSDRIEAEILDVLGEEVVAAVDTPLVVIEGPKGDPGTAGKDGHSPVVTATKSGKTTTISVDGAAIATVEDGADGKPGAAGSDGITPTIGDNGNWYLGAEDTGKPSRGEKGEKGDTGAAGPRGETGPQGTPGKDGANGKDGKPGEKGADGAPGIYYGTTQPTGDTHPVWIDPGGDHDDGGLLPAVTAADNGKVLRVVSNAWAAADMPGGGGECGCDEDFELIMDDTVPANATGYTNDKDINGEIFALREWVLILWTPAHTDDDHGNYGRAVGFIPASKWGDNVFRVSETVKKSDGIGRYDMLHIKVVSGYQMQLLHTRSQNTSTVFGVMQQDVAAGAAPICFKTDATALFENSNAAGYATCVKIFGYSSEYVPAGTHIKLYGKRVKS